MPERQYEVTALVQVTYEVDATSAEAAADIVRGYRDELDHPAQALGLVAVEAVNCYEETTDAD